MRILKRAALLAAGVIVLVCLALYGLLRGSLPKLDGELAAAELVATVSIERDALGVVTISAVNRADLAYATGYAHAQDRFFQMDLQRRVAAGELAELLGKEFVALDQRFRRHNFRAVARAVLERATPEQKQTLAAYVSGVNAAREATRVRPFEYLLLRTSPTPWTVEDSLLIAFTMYIDLNDSDGAHELERARLHAALPQAVFDLLYPRGSEWDATLDDVDLAKLSVAVPGPEVIDFRKQPPSSVVVTPPDVDYPGSNNWALAGSRVTGGGALLANDMHLSLRLPHIWYRARLIVKSSDVGEARDLMGVTLPGLPLLIAGSNGRIAWGYTNAHGDFDDLVVIESDAQHLNRYRNGDGYLDFSPRREQIKVRGGATVEVEYRDTLWGPMLDEDLDGKPLALAWTAQRADATNLGQLELETATSTLQALDIANTTGIPVQNFVVADEAGHIGWTPIGKLPKRIGYDGRLPTCWGCAERGTGGWQGWVAPQDYPRIVDPYRGQVWTANSRTLGGSGADLIGDEDMDRGARTKQIRDALLALKQATPQDLLAVQLDDRALFLKRWRDLLVRLLDEAYLRGNPTRRVALEMANEWSGRASVDDAAYRLTRAFRAAVQEQMYSALTTEARKRYPNARFKPSARFEDSLWRIVTEQPPHLLDPKFPTWDYQLLAALDKALAQLQEECGTGKQDLMECTWGKRNKLVMEHPLATALPLLGRALRMPVVSLPGDADMPRVQGRSFGASERFVVSPGREAAGYFHMPGGQSGHPLSPFFKAGHEAWIEGEPTPFLPGESRYTLRLTPR